MRHAHPPSESLHTRSGFVLCAILALAACGERTVERPDPGPPLEELDLEGLQVGTGDPDVVFQYVDPVTGKPVAVTAPDKVPEGQREMVVVLFSGERRDRLPARALVLADLTSPGEDGRFSVRVVNRWEHAAPAMASADGPGAQVAPPAGAPAGVVLYTAAGCPHCTRARSWLTEKEVPFVEKDVSSDPTAAPEIAALGKAQGIPESYLSSVPLLAIDGKLLVGFDPRQVEAALARR